MKEYFDIHTHILPHNDDGSSSCAESIEMLSALYSQGATRVAMTPHFKASGDEPEKFLKRRQATTERLLNRLDELSCNDADFSSKLPDIYLGAEVAFFNAMSNVTALRDMCLSGTDYLLVEMPFDRWTIAMVDELQVLMKKQGIIPIIAHIDRYFACFKAPMLDAMLKAGIKVQINADAFLSLWTRRRALELLETGKVHFIGSDSHNMSKRVPNISAGVEEITKRIGEGALDKIIQNSNELAQQAKPIFCRGGRACD